jgi:transglutaminase-like putative cysteine protease
MIYQVDHLTHVDYDAPVRVARFNLRLEPTSWPEQSVSDYRLDIDPAPSDILPRNGVWPVNVARVTIDGPLSTLSVRSRFTVQVEDAMLDMPGDGLSVAQAARAAVDWRGLDARAPANYLHRSPLVPLAEEICDWARDTLRPDAPALDAGLALARRIQAEFRYDPDATDTKTPVRRAFAMHRGVCQDFSHVLIVALRAMGLPAAYVSGYLRTLPPPGQPRLIGVDAMHAWVALWCGPQRGWVGLDPTNGCITGTDHIFVAMGRDYADVAPIDGVVVGKGAQHLVTSVDVMPLGE